MMFSLPIVADLTRLAFLPEFARPMMHADHPKFTRSCPMFQDENANVKGGKGDFEINVNVKHFKPEEITVKVLDENVICIDARHEERKDDLGSVSRHFVRKYALPEGFDISKLESNLSTEGVLVLRAPKIAKTIQIPIIQTEKPSTVDPTKSNKTEDIPNEVAQ